MGKESALTLLENHKTVLQIGSQGQQAHLGVGHVALMRPNSDTNSECKN